MESTTLLPHTLSSFPLLLSPPKQALLHPLSFGVRGVPGAAERAREKASEGREKREKERHELEGGGGREAHGEAQEAEGFVDG